MNGMSSNTESKENFGSLVQYIEEEFGIKFNDQKAYLLESRLASLILCNQCQNFGALVYKLKTTNDLELRKAFINAITTRETYWFREDRPWQVMEEQILPKLINRLNHINKKKIRIWSAGCSTGQEPYSLAISILKTLNRNTYSPMQFEIIATDISAEAIAFAQRGSYQGLDIKRGMQESVLKKFFIQSDSGYIVKDCVHRMVRFETFNLKRSFFLLGKFDFILCRNVMIYFSEEFKQVLLQKFEAALNPGSYFMMGGSESILNNSSGLEIQDCKEAIYYRNSLKS